MAQNDEVNALCKEVFTAVRDMNSPETPSDDRKRINVFLSMEFPKHRHSWEVLNRFLKEPKLTNEQHFFAANMFCKKLAADFTSIPRQAHAQVRDALMQHLAHFYDLPNGQRQDYRNVRTQLCLAIVYVLIQRPDWEDGIQLLMRRFGQPKLAALLLRVLTVYAEEIYNWKLPLSYRLRKRTRHNLEKHAGQVLDMLDQLFNSAGNQVSLQLLVFKCFNAWIFVMENVNNQLLGTSKLSACLFKALERDELFAVASDSIVKMLNLQGPPRFDDEEETTFQRELWRKSFDFIMPNVIETLPKFREALRNENWSVVRPLVCIYNDAGETYLEWVTQGSSEAKLLLRAILEATKLHTHHDISEYTLYFWERFLEPFVREVRAMRPEHSQDDFADFPRRWDGWAEWFVRHVFPELIPALVHNCEYPQDVDDLASDEQDLVYQHRWRCSDVLATLARILGSRHLLRVVLGILQPLMPQDGAEPSDRWDPKIEAVLFAIRSNYRVAAYPDEKHPLAELFRRIPLLPNTHWRTRKSAVSLIGKHCNFLSVDDAVFDGCMSYVCASLGNTKTSNSAAHCVRCICEHFAHEPQFTRRYWDKLLVIYDKSYKLNINDANEITVALVELVRYTETHNAARHLIGRLLEMPKDHVNTFLQRGVTSITVEGVRITLDETLKRLASIWKYFQPVLIFPEQDAEGHAIDPVLIFFFKKFWPAFKAILQRHHDDDEIMEKCTRCIKHTIRLHPEQWQEVDEFRIVLDAMVGLFLTSPRSCFLYIVDVYVDEYGEERRFEELLLGALDKVSSRCFRLLGHHQDFVDHPDIVEDYFELVAVYLKRMPGALLEKNWVIQIFAKALEGVLLEHREASEAVLNFFREFVSLGVPRSARGGGRHRRGSSDSDREDRSPAVEQRFRQKVGAVLRESGERLVKRLLRGIAYDVSFARIGKMTELLEELFRFDSRWLLQAMRENIEKIPVHTEDPSKEEFLADFERSRDRTDRRRLVADFWRAAERYVMRNTYQV